MKNVWLLVLLTSCSTSAFSKVSTEIFCFNSGDPKPIRFEMRTYFDSDTKWEGGFIKYEKSKSLISISLKNKQTSTLSKEMPQETTKTWLEVSGNKITGEYEFISQGTNVYSMQYTNSNNKKQYLFDLDTNVPSSPESGCQW
jgi:hypothetical protein